MVWKYLNLEASRSAVACWSTTVNPCPKPSSTCFGETWAWFFTRLTQIGSLSFSAHLVTDAQSRKNADGGSARKKVFLILDNLRVHHSKLVKAWLAEKQEKIEVLYLPSYSPQLSPDERLNANLNYAIGSQVPLRTKTKPNAATATHMQMLQTNPDRVKSYLGDPRCAYAA